MAHDQTRTYASNGRSGPLRLVVHVSGRAAATALRPLNAPIGAAIEMGMSLQRRAVDRLLDSRELERVMVEAVESRRVQTALQIAISSDAANRLVDSFFDSGMFDRLVERLLESDGLWYLVDEVAQSPAVLAAVSQQGLGFADQVGEQVRDRSSRADDWLERAARRVIGRRSRRAPDASAAAPDKPGASAAAPDSPAAPSAAPDTPAASDAAPDKPAASDAASVISEVEIAPVISDVDVIPVASGVDVLPDVPDADAPA
ncbi:MAG: hypothetical protein ACJ780_01760 [Solirubrobacteraceae bacterium]